MEEKHMEKYLIVKIVKDKEQMRQRNKRQACLKLKKN